MLHNGHPVRIVGKIGLSVVKTLSRMRFRLGGHAGVVFDPVIRVISGYISNCYCWGASRVLSLLSFSVGTSAADAVLTDPV